MVATTAVGAAFDTTFLRPIRHPLVTDGKVHGLPRIGYRGAVSATCQRHQWQAEDDMTPRRVLSH